MARMGKPIVIALAFAAGIAAFAVPAGAAGVGVSLQGEAGSVTWEFKSDVSGDADVDGDLLGVGVGFVFDTNCARDELVNYRINANLMYNDMDFEHVSESDATVGIFADNYVGFGVIRNPKLRLWVGPHVRLGYFKGVGDGLTDGMVGAEFGVGPAAGLNLHLNREMDLGLTAGLRYSFVNGTWEDSAGNDEDFSGNSSSFFFNVALLFRGIDDTFGAK